MDPKHWAYVACGKDVLGKDGNGEVMRDSKIVHLKKDSVESEGANIDGDMNALDASLDDREIVLRFAKEEWRDAILQVLDSGE